MKLVSDWKERREAIGGDMMTEGEDVASSADSELDVWRVGGGVICGWRKGCFEWKGSLFSCNS